MAVGANSGLRITRSQLFDVGFYLRQYRGYLVWGKALLGSQGGDYLQEIKTHLISVHVRFEGLK